jgi:hypothetical protein
MTPDNNEYHLRDELRSEVDPNWKFYDAMTRRVVQSKLKQKNGGTTTTSPLKGGIKLAGFVNTNNGHQHPLPTCTCFI